MKRIYPCSGLALLLVASTLAQNFEEEKAAFVEESAVWDDPYIENFKTAVETVLSTVFGINPSDNQKAATKQVTQLMNGSKDDLLMVKNQIVRGYRKDPEKRDLLLDQLGYQLYWPQARTGVQEAMIGLLVKFRNNLTAADRTDMELKMVGSERLDHILENASTLQLANTDQENQKFNTHEGVDAVIAELNEIYAKCMDICSIGQELFKSESAKKAKFTFSKILRKQRSTTSGESQEKLKAAQTSPEHQ